MDSTSRLLREIKNGYFSQEEGPIIKRALESIQYGSDTTAIEAKEAREYFTDIIAYCGPLKRLESFTLNLEEELRRMRENESSKKYTRAELIAIDRLKRVSEELFDA